MSAKLFTSVVTPSSSFATKPWNCLREVRLCVAVSDSLGWPGPWCLNHDTTSFIFLNLVDTVGSVLFIWIIGQWNIHPTYVQSVFQASHSSRWIFTSKATKRSRPPGTHWHTLRDLRIQSWWFTIHSGHNLKGNHPGLYHYIEYVTMVWLVPTTYLLYQRYQISHNYILYWIARSSNVLACTPASANSCPRVPILGTPQLWQNVLPSITTNKMQRTKLTWSHFGFVKLSWSPSELRWRCFYRLPSWCFHNHGFLPERSCGSFAEPKWIGSERNTSFASVWLSSATGACWSTQSRKPWHQSEPRVTEAFDCF